MLCWNHHCRTFLQPLLLTVVVLTSSLQAADKDEKQGPRIIQEPENVIFDTEGSFDYVYLDCEAEGNPYPEYEWRKDNSPLDIANNNRLTLINGRLSISDPDDSADEGEYQCFAFNEIGRVASKKIKFQFGFIGEFQSSGADKTIQEFRYIALECPEIDAFPGLVYSWQKGNPGESGFFPVLVSSQNRHIGRNGKLYIGRATDDDKGDYACKVQNSISTLASSQKISNTITLKVTSTSDTLIEPTQMHAVGDKKVMRGQDTSLQCFFGGSPSPSHRWRRKSPSSNMPASSTTNEHGQTLLLNNVQPEDSGEYECVAEAYYGSGPLPYVKVSSGTLTVVTPPELVEALEDADRAVGETQVFRCEADSSDPVIYRWYRDGLEIGSLARHSFGDSGRQLTISDLVEDDSAMYQCEGYNQPLAPDDDTVYSVITTAQLIVLDISPYFINELLKNQPATVDGQTEIVCEATGAPKPTLTWNHNGLNVFYDSRVSQDPETGNLLIDPVRQEDDGEYECVATNTGGSQSSKGSLVVFAGTTVSVLEKATVELSKDITIDCNPKVDPSLEFVTLWLHNGRVIDVNEDSHYDLVSGSDLKIKDAEMKHRGNYTCYVLTTIDEASASNNLTVVGPPGPPAGVKVIDFQDFQVELSWNIGADNGKPITDYVIQASSQYRPEWHDVKELASISGDNLKTMVNELSPYSSYQFRVAAVNSYGQGQPSLPSDPVVLKAAPPQATVANIRGEGANREDLRIVWDLLKPDQENGPNVFYKVSYRLDGQTADTDWTSIDLKEPKQGVLSVRSVNPYTKYNVKIMAGNSEGDGPDSPDTDVYSWQEVPLQRPTEIRAKVLSASKVEVTFKGINTEDIEGDLMGYKILYESSSEEDRITLTTTKENDEVTGTVKGLANNTEYSFTAQAFSGGGVGPVSKESYKVITFKSAPTKAPQNIRVEKESDTSVTVFWESISVDPSYEEPLTGYKVLFRDDDEFVEESVAFVIKSTSAQSVTIPGLKKSKGYLIEVLGYSQGGDGKRSTPVRFSLDDPVFGFLSNAPRMQSVWYSLLFNILAFHFFKYIW